MQNATHTCLIYLLYSTLKPLLFQISGILFNDGHAIVFNGSVHWNAQRQKQHLIQNEDAKNDQNSAASQQQQNTSNPLAVALQSSSRLLVSTTNLTDEELLESAVQLDHRTRPKRTSLINTILVTGRAGTGAEDSFNDEVHKVDEPTGGASSVSLELEKLTEGIDIGIGQAGRLAFISGDEDDRVQPEVGEESMVSGAFSSMAETQNQADQSSVIISGADLAYDYKFEAFYLRFGSQNSRGGSEHQVNSHSYAGELQMISYNSQLYRSFNEAVNKPNGVMAIAILIDIAPIETPPTTTATATSTQESNDVPEKPPTTTSVQAVAPNAHLEQLLSHIDQLKHRTSMVSIGALNVSALLSDSDQFVAYEGSLTTPGCYESVHWLILNRPLYISQRNVSSAPILFSNNYDVYSTCHQVGKLRDISTVLKLPSASRVCTCVNMQPSGEVHIQWLCD